MAAAFPDEMKATPEQAYSSLSILALIGFGIAALHAAAIVLMTIVGLFTQTPLLLSLWTLLVPLSAILLCLLARGRIRSSEGTLAGETLARWGLLLTLFTGLGYWAYYTAVYFAVRQQARAYAEEWIETLRIGDTTRAAAGVLPPLKRLGLNGIADDSVLEVEVEQRLLGLEGSGKPVRPVNMVSTFTQNPLVRQIVQGGKEVNVVLKGVSSWSYVRGGYEVVLLYDLELPEGAVEATITTHGETAPQSEYERRQWYVDMRQSRLHEQDTLARLTDQGRASARVRTQAAQFLVEVLGDLRASEHQAAYLLTLPSAQREQARKDLDKIGPLAAAAGPLGAALAMPEGRTLESFEQFCDGKLIQTDAKRFHLPEKERQEAIAEVRKLFALQDAPLRLEPAQTPPLHERQGDRLRYKYDVRISGLSSYILEGFVEIECDAKVLESQRSQPEWRFVALRLLSGRKLPAPK